MERRGFLGRLLAAPAAAAAIVHQPNPDGMASVDGRQVPVIRVDESPLSPERDAELVEFTSRQIREALQRHDPELVALIRQAALS